MSADVEALLREAFPPIEPPAALSAELETKLATITGLAQEELEGWELSTMRDPRNWVRPAAAVAVTATAGTALVVLRVRGRQRARAAERDGANLREMAGRTLQDFAEEARKVLPDR